MSNQPREALAETAPVCPAAPAAETTSGELRLSRELHDSAREDMVDAQATEDGDLERFYLARAAVFAQLSTAAAQRAAVEVAIAATRYERISLDGAETVTELLMHLSARDGIAYLGDLCEEAAGAAVTDADAVVFRALSACLGRLAAQGGR